MSRFSNLEFGDQFDERASAQTNKDGGYYLGEARAAFALGRFEQALRSYSKVLEFENTNPEAWCGQVRMLIELGEFNEAKLWADKALEHLCDDPELLAAKAVALARTGDLKAALAFSDAAIEARGDTPYVWIARGDVLLARGEKRADFCFDKAFGLRSGDWMIRWLVSRIFYYYRQFSRAFKMAQDALALDAARPVLWLQFGRCQLALGLAAPAANSFDQARQLDPLCRPEIDEQHQASSSSVAARIVGWWRKVSGS
jgi:tetratricopeptide (TPR) repeat protein